MGSRYKNRRPVVNNTPRDKTIRQNRGVKSITHYATPKMFYPNDVINVRLETVNHTWKLGDHYYKLSHKYYGDPSYWWVIAFYNQTPTEHLLNYGDVIEIPVNLSSILQAIGY